MEEIMKRGKTQQGQSSVQQKELFHTNPVQMEQRKL
jgi:hypothetical protein